MSRLVRLSVARISLLATLHCLAIFNSPSHLGRLGECGSGCHSVPRECTRLRRSIGRHVHALVRRLIIHNVESV
jgi:hypothetical protein